MNIFTAFLALVFFLAVYKLAKTIFKEDFNPNGHSRLLNEFGSPEVSNAVATPQVKRYEMAPYL